MFGREDALGTRTDGFFIIFSHLNLAQNSFFVASLSALLAEYDIEMDI